MNEERDRFLTEAMGLCWHDYDLDKPLNTYSLEAYICTKCKGFILGNNDFSQEEDFMRLLAWVRNQEHLRQFAASFNEKELTGALNGPTREDFVNRLYGLLKG